MVGMVLISSDEHMDKTPSHATCSCGTCSTPLVLAATTTPTGATLATGDPVSTFCMANAPGEDPRPPFADQPTISSRPSTTRKSLGVRRGPPPSHRAALGHMAAWRWHTSAPCCHTSKSPCRRLKKAPEGDKFAGGTLESYGSAYHPCCLAFCDCAHGNGYVTWDWEHGWDPWRALCSHEDRMSVSAL